MERDVSPLCMQAVHLADAEALAQAGIDRALGVLQEVSYLALASAWTGDDVVRAALGAVEGGPSASEWLALPAPAKSITARTTPAMIPLLAQRAVGLDRRALRLAQLRSGIRALRSVADRPHGAALTAQPVSLVAALSAVVLAAHASAAPEETARELAESASELLVVAKTAGSGRATDTVTMTTLPDRAARALALCGHPVAASVADPLVRPALLAMATAAAAGTPDGVIDPWASPRPAAVAVALLGRARASLLAPPALVDPAGAAAHDCARVSRLAALVVGPEALARSLAASVPGSTPQTAQLEALASETARLRRDWRALRRKCVARPLQSRYMDLERQVSRLLSETLSVDRVLCIVARLESHSDSAAPAEGFSLAEAARGACESLRARFPLYEDVTLPLRQSLLEIALGVSMLSVMAAHPQVKRTVVCIAFPVVECPICKASLGS